MNPNPRTSAVSARSVDITQTGRGGSIYYREGGNSIEFGWEFAASPAIALVFGPPGHGWDKAYPWARGRQAEIVAFVGSEIVRRKAPGAACEIDLVSGDMTIVRKSIHETDALAVHLGRPPAKPKQTPAFQRFFASIVPSWEQWPEGKTYDLAAIPDMSAFERRRLVDLLTARDVTWREVEALAAIDTPAARAAVKAASKDHLSIDTRVAAAAFLHRQGRMEDIDGFLARQIRNLSRPAEGMERTLSAAADHPSETVKQALLWASYNCTECAPHCAALLLKLTGAAIEPFNATVREMLSKLDLHNSSYDRQAAFDALSALVGMELDPNQGN
jgi:hypothetical protein